MTRFSKKSSTISLNSSLSIFSTSKPYNPLDHFEICINITKNINLPIPESHKSFYDSYIRFISFKKYPQVDRRFEIDTSKRPLIVSCYDATKYMTELALPEKYDKLKYNFNWSMERWKIMYKKRIAIEKFKNLIKKVMNNLRPKKTIVSIKCDPWIHYMPDPYQDSTVYSTKYCLKKIQEENCSYFVCDEEYFSEDKYHYFYLNDFNETLEDSEDEDIELPSSFNNNYNYKEGLITVKRKKKLNTKNLQSTGYKMSNNNSHKNEFIYFVKKIIMERKKTNPSGDPWDAFFYIHMKPDKKNLTFKINRKEIKNEKHFPIPRVECLDEQIINDENEIISPLCSISLSPQSSDYDNGILSSITEITNDNSTELIEKNEEIVEKKSLNNEENNQTDKNEDLKSNDNTINSPKYLNESMGLSRKITLDNKSFLQFAKINNTTNHDGNKISEKEEIIVESIPKNVVIESCDRGTNTLPSIYKQLPVKNSKYKRFHYEKIKVSPRTSKKQSLPQLKWKVSTVVRYSPDGKTHLNRSFYLPRIVRPNLQKIPIPPISIPFSTNPSVLPQLISTTRPSSSLKNNPISASRQNLL
uniref:HMG box domain-containing protein n=1 Tax=Strongyloides stercoralis TaxID=6248 RepID=A0A0K0DUF5_STRER